MNGKDLHISKNVYVAIYRELQREAKGEIEAVQRMKENEVDIEEISFEPVDWRPRMRSFSSPLRRAYNSLENRDLQPPDLQHIIFHRKIPRTTEEFAHVEKKQYLCTGFQNINHVAKLVKLFNICKLWKRKIKFVCFL